MSGPSSCDVQRGNVILLHVPQVFKMVDSCIHTHIVIVAYYLQQASYLSQSFVLEIRHIAQVYRTGFFLHVTRCYFHNTNLSQSVARMWLMSDCYFGYFTTFFDYTGQ